MTSPDYVSRLVAAWPITTARSEKGKEVLYPCARITHFGHTLADSFKEGLKEFYPEAQLVGEDYHKLFLTDFAPYLTKIKASGAEVICTGRLASRLG